MFRNAALDHIFYFMEVAMAILTPGSAFADTIPVGCGEDTLELYNPTVADVADIRVGLVASIQEHCAAPYGDALQNEQVLEYLTREVIPKMRDLLWREYGMPDDDRAYRAALSRMSDEQVTALPQVYIESVGIDAVLDAAARSDDAVGNT